MRTVLFVTGILALMVAGMGTAHARLDPVPEPSSLAALGAGVASVVLAKVFKKR